ncbi:helix-turn-helix transcriptional regulator [Oceanobacillus salinisoli]|uniref:helix-turn-helix transcriptional regulator n=1 Tax=Oceanobacillus salinisoli TaxID=2678611 RepID=UPI0012E111C2|nr:helix-turn-helix domain-containing protein [Oceanobacillus salinisoli]
MHWELIKLRKEKKINQEQMALLLGIDRSTYSLKESGKYDFKLQEIFIIAKFFNKQIDEIFLPINIEKHDIINKNIKKSAN